MKLAKHVKFREEAFGGVLFETRTEQVFSLNPTAAVVVREIDRGRAEREIVDRLREDFHDREATMAREATAFIAELRDRGLVEN